MILQNLAVHIGKKSLIFSAGTVLSSDEDEIDETSQQYLERLEKAVSIELFFLPVRLLLLVCKKSPWAM